MRKTIGRIATVAVCVALFMCLFFGTFMTGVMAEDGAEDSQEPGSEAAEQVKLESVDFSNVDSEKTLELFEGQKKALVVQKTPENADEEVVLESQNPEIVKVDENSITAQKINDSEMIENNEKYKDTVIVVRNQDGTVIRELKVRVKVAVKSITITPTRNGISKYSVVLRTNKSNKTYLKVKVSPSNAYSKKYTVSFKKKKFTMKKTAKDTFLITAKPYKKKYISYFTVTSTNAAKKITVKKRIYGVKVAKKLTVKRTKTPKAKIRVHNINAGRKIKLKAVPVTKGVTTNAVIWKSKNPKIATVNKNGVVKAVKPGKVKIVATAMYNTKAKAAFVVRVHKPVILTWPIHTKFDDQYNVESFFGGGRNHKGIDIICGVKKVYAAGEGKVVKVSYDGGYGKCVVVKHPGGGKTLYSHLSSYSKYAKKGKKVTSKTCLGKSGSTGRATCAHLHFEIQTKDDNDPFSAVKHTHGKHNHNPAFKQAGDEYVYDPDFIWPE